MPSTYSQRLRLELQATGENRSTWGGKNNNVITLEEAAIAGAALIPMGDADHTLTTANAVTDEARNAILIFSGALTAVRTVTIPTVSKIYMVSNSTTGGFSINFKAGAGTGPVATVLNGQSQLIWTDGTYVFAGASPAGCTPEAPNDGKMYVRQNSGWLAIQQPFTYDVNGDAVLKFGSTIVIRIKSTGLILTKDDIEVFSTSV